MYNSLEPNDISEHRALVSSLNTSLLVHRETRLRAVVRSTSASPQEGELLISLMLEILVAARQVWLAATDARCAALLNTGQATHCLALMIA